MASSLFSMGVQGLLLIVGAVLAIEALLQIAAFITWITHRRRVAIPSDATRSILCVGDSYTYGMGASSAAKSYPAQLEELLLESGRQLRVANGGWPSRNSREVLESLGMLLRTTKPRIVYVLVGANDLWSKPSLLVLEPDALEKTRASASRFPLTWRTRRFVLLLRHKLAARRSDVGAVSTPRAAKTGPAEASYQQGSTQTSQESLVAAGWRALEAGDVAAGRRFFTLANHHELQENVDAHVGLVKVHVLSGRQDEVERELVWIANRREQEPGNHRRSEQLVYALEIAGETEEALRVAQDAVGGFPRNVWLWKSVAWHVYQRGNTEEALKAIDEALRWASPDDLEAREHFFDVRADILRHVNPPEAVRSAICSYLVRGDEARFVQWLQVGGKAMTADLLARSLVDLNLTADERQRVERLYQTAMDSPSSDTMKVLESHLTQIVNVARAARAEPVFLSYPFHSRDLENLTARVASRMGAGWINVRELFDARLRTTPREQVFVSDGHLSDDGYRIVASVVAADARLRLSPPRIGKETAAALTLPDVTSQRFS